MSSTEEAVQTLQAAFGAEQVLLPGTEAYTKRNSSYLARQESELEPAAIVQPANTAEVAKFLKTIQPHTESGSVRFAIRGAGNQPVAGCANITGGITLDLARLNQVVIEGTSSASVGAGALWGAVNEAAQAKGLGVVGGRSGTCGIGGLALAGGLSFFSSREGFIADNVLSFEIVLADGQVVTASATERADLHWALRGGGNHFGVVTRFDVATFPLPVGPPKPLWGGNVYYFPPSFPGQIDALVSELNKGDDADPDTHFMVSTGYAAQFGQFMCLNTVYSTKEGTTEAPAVLQPFTQIEPQVNALTDLKPLTLTEAAAGQAASLSLGVRCSYMNITIRPDAATLKVAADIYRAALDPVKDAAGLICSFTLQPYALSLLRASEKKGGNPLGLSSAHGPAVSILLLTYWSAEADDARLTKALRSALDKIHEEAVRNKSALDFVYLNYAADFQDPFASYGEANKLRLQEVSRKYDPQGFFQKVVPRMFKLFP